MSDENEDIEEYGELDEETKRALKGVRSKAPKQELTIEAQVNPDMLKKSAWFDDKAKKLAEQLRDVGENVDSSKITPSNFGEYVSKLKGKLAEIRQEADPTRRSSSGTLTLDSQSSTGGEAFEDYQSMINFLQRRKHSRTSTPEEKYEATQVLNELWRKFLRGKKGKAKNEGFDPIEDEGTPLLRKFYQEWKKREGED